jgi:CRISPR-associated protein Csm3
MAMFKLLGRLLISGTVEAVTGLHIGGSPAAIGIGALDNPVIRDPRTRAPYLPGSSLKGKLRSLAERARGFDPDNRDQVQRIGQVRIHVCRKEADYNVCPVCQVFGLPGELDHSAPTRLTVRDAFLERASLEGAQTDFLYSEVKWEASIDRITSAALPRQIERVPAGARFRSMLPTDDVPPVERPPEALMVLSFYDLGRGTDFEFSLIRQLLLAMQLLEDDYLGGLGSRGSGKVRFINLQAALRKGSARIDFAQAQLSDLASLLAAEQTLIDWTRDNLRAEG